MFQIKRNACGEPVKATTKISKHKKIEVTPFRGNLYFHITDDSKFKSLTVNVEELDVLAKLAKEVDALQHTFIMKPQRREAVATSVSVGEQMLISPKQGFASPVMGQCYERITPPPVLTPVSFEKSSLPSIRMAESEAAQGILHETLPHAIVEEVTTNEFPGEEEVFFAVPITLPQ